MSMNTSSSFLQDPPRLGNVYLEDSPLLEILARRMPKEIMKEIEPDLIRFGQRNLEDILEHGRDSEKNPPKLTHYNAWGHRIDEIKVAHGWKVLQDISAEEGLISIAYERKYKEWSRVYQLLKIYLFASSSCVFGCPLAMTDGAARLIELWGKPEDKSGPYAHLTSRDPKQFWTSGQWMTEKTGGSDISNTETIAKKDENGDDRTYRLTGYKYFTSAITSEMALTLARIVDKDGQSVKGSPGLSCFLIRTRKEDGSLNNIAVHRLKEKMGTKAVPTAELELLNAEAKLIGPSQKGVPVISTILNITRIHNAVHSVASMRRGIALARDYAVRRKAFGDQLSNKPLHLTTLAAMEVEYRGSLQLLIEVSILLGKNEVKCNDTDGDVMLRILTPLLKLFCGKLAVASNSEAIEAIGGNGYMEDSDIPRLLRDVQVTSIWEGTTNVLSLDVWRPIRSGALDTYIKVILAKLSKMEDRSDLKSTIQLIRSAVDQIRDIMRKYTESGDKEFIEATARSWAYSLARTYIAVLLLEQAHWSSKPVDVEVASRWCLDQPLVSQVSLAADPKYRDLTRQIALDVDPKNGKPRGVGDVMPDGTPRARY